MESLFVPAGSSTTFSKQLLCKHTGGNTIKHTPNNWKGTFLFKPLCDLKGLGVKRLKWIAFVFPFASLKYWNTKSFWKEIMLQGLQRKLDSLHENKFLQIRRVWVGVCLCYKCKACWDRFLWSSSRSKCFNAGLMSNLKVHGGGAVV